MTEDAQRQLGARRAELIRATLSEALHADVVEVKDRSWQHRNHAGASDGRGHFDVTIVSSRFEGQTRLARHRMVYDALGDLVASDIHALSIRALVPGE